MSIAEALRVFAKPLIEPIAGRSGRVLYSAAETLRPGPLYLLGLNPGGNPAVETETVAESLASLPARRENPTSMRAGKENQSASPCFNFVFNGCSSSSVSLPEMCARQISSLLVA
jgi:hypothetical protein